MKISFVSVLYNHSEDLVQRCIDSIHDVMKNNYNIILINNGDNRYYNLKQKFEIINNYQNNGYCGGNNTGIKFSKSECVIVINPDIQLLDSSGIERMIDNCMTKNTISGRLVGDEKWYTFPSSFPTDKKYTNYDLPFFFYESTLNKPGNWKPFKYIDGSLMAFSKLLWEEIGGFDEDFFPGYFGENVFAFKSYLKYSKFILSDCNIEKTYNHDSNNSKLNMSLIETITKHARLLFYYKYALNNWNVFLNYLNE